jgi:phospholipid/cholesterol/gamma-HCH transport system substrate-binding protein
MNDQRTERALKLKVGLFVLAALAAFLGMIYLLGARAHLFERQYVIHAEFTEVGGLADGATVRLAGVQIGRVTGVHLPDQPGGKVRVDLTIGAQFSKQVRKDSVARIDTQGLLGDRIVEVSVGTPAAPPAGPGEVLVSRDPTDLRQVINESAQTVKNITALAESLRQTAETLNQSRLVQDAAAAVGEMRRLAESLGRELASTAAAARATTATVNRIVERVEKGPGPAHALLYDSSVDVGKVLADSARAMQNIEAAAATLRRTADTVNDTKVVEEAVAAVRSVRRLTDEVGRQASGAAAAAREAAERVGRIAERVERGPGLAHALLYEEPLALARVNELIARTDALVARVERGEGAVGVLTSAESTAAARRLVAALDTLARTVEKPQEAEGLLPALLFDPTYKAVLEDARVVARNLREVSDRVAGGQGTLGALVKDTPEEGGIRQASRDLQAAMANLRSITEKLDEGQGTLGALLADPTIYERLSAILDSSGRSFLLRSLIRGLGTSPSQHGQR